MNISFWFSHHGLVIGTHGPQGKGTFVFPYSLLSIFGSTHGPAIPLFNEVTLRHLAAESHNSNFHKNPPGEEVEPGNIPTKVWELPGGLKKGIEGGDSPPWKDLRYK